MSPIKKIISRLDRNDFFIIFISIFAVLIRFLPHSPNLTPVGAAVVATGFLSPKKSLLIFPLIALFVSDLFIGFYSFPVMLSVYVGFLIMGLCGRLFGKYRDPLFATIASISGSLFFFFITNSAVWAFTPMYAKNISGLLQSYVMALPFFRNSLLADIGYVLLFWLVHALVVRKTPLLSTDKNNLKTLNNY